MQTFLVLAPLAIILPLKLNDRGLYDLYGVVLGARAAGFVAGTMLAAQLRAGRPGLLAQCGHSTLLALLACLLLPVPSWLLVCAATFGGLGPALFVVYWPAALQRAIPLDLRGRVFATDHLGAYALYPIGLAITPLAVEELGFAAPLTVAMLLLVLTVAAPLAVPGVSSFATPPSAANQTRRDGGSAGT